MWKYIKKNKKTIEIIGVVIAGILLVIPIIDYYGIRIKIPIINELEFDPEFSISSILEIIVISVMAWEIRATRKNLLIEKDLENADSLNQLIDDITFTLGKPETRIMNREIKDEKCRKLFNTILTRLNENKPDEKNLMDCLNRYKIEDPNFPEWIKEIDKLGKTVITNYKKI